MNDGVDNYLYTDSSELLLTHDILIGKLRQAVGPRGDFPVSARIIDQIFEIIDNPNATVDSLSKIISRDPTLSTRIIHVVNSAFYKRSTKISNLSQAIMHLGMGTLEKLCSSLVLLEKFIPIARREGPFARSFSKSIVTIVINDMLHKEYSDENNDENTCDPLASTLSTLGGLLLAYYYPDVYNTAIYRSHEKSQCLNQSILEITGISTLEMSIEIIDRLSLPERYVQIIRDVQESLNSWVFHSTSNSKIARNVNFLAVSSSISDLIATNIPEERFFTLVRDIIPIVEISTSGINSLIKNLPRTFNDYCNSLDIKLPFLPQYINNYTTIDIDINVKNNKKITKDHPVNSYISDLKDALTNRSSKSVLIATAMEALKFGLNFDRVIYFEYDFSNEQLKPRLSIGDIKNKDKQIILKTSENNSVIKSWKNSSVNINCKPILENGWPVTVIPICCTDTNSGVLYADRIEKLGNASDSENEEISDSEHAIIMLISQLIDKAL